MTNLKLIVLIPLVALAGCAADGMPNAKTPRETGSIKPQAAPAYDPSVKYSRAWCQNRFIQHEKGQHPGGADTLEVKRAHDQKCTEVLKGGS